MEKRLSKLITISSAHFFNDFYMSLIPPISVIFAQKFGLSLTLQGLLVFVITGFGNFSQPIVGSIIDKKGKTYFIIFSLIWISFWMSITGLINNFYLLLFVVAIASMASSLFHPLASATVLNIGKESKGKILSVFMTIGTLAGAVSPMIAVPLVSKYGLSSMVYFMIPGLIIASLMYVFKVQDIKFVTHNKKSDIKVKISNYAKKIMMNLVIISMNRSFIRRTMIAFGIQILMIKGVSFTTGTILLTVHLFFSAGGTLFGGVLNDILGSRMTLIICNIISGIFLLILVFSTGIVSALAFILLGLAISLTNTSSVLLSHEIFPKNKNTGYGFVSGFASGMSGIGLLIVGKFADVYDLNTAIKFIVLPVAILIILSLLIPKEIDKSAV